MEAEEGRGENCKEKAEEKVAADAGADSSSRAEDSPDRMDNISQQDMNDENESYIGFIEELPATAEG